ncbi:oxidoreductase [Salpingoeca rosetta]|uniref:Oxidoreductase n=1 Tax=Salpingoeca rosetta (strain ATCC 50818 / BSB-021) TaxID=946362 RepID=F2UJG3_SALR5|nr:oxidoreductase [Salpingoeca rosetta]EGD77262.1 oxidoreductase [Salpingoeca rosetta]|eukprot:XP_004990606.1 oxidoreductase [Salpingoeca rosetta]
MSLCKPGVLMGILAVLLYLLFVFPVKYFPVHDSGAILITGTSTGIGRHAAVELAKKGYTVYATVRKQADVDSLKKEGVNTLIPIVMDVTKPDQIASAVDTIKKGGHKLIGLVNNAGISARVPLEAHDLDRIRSMFEVNVFGVVSVTQAFLPMIRENKGRIVNVGSLAGFIAMPGSASYSATKFGLEGLNDALRREMAPFGVSVSIVEPAYVSTAIASKSTGEAAATRWVSREMQDTYAWFFADFEEKRLKGEALADGPEVTTKAITHALTSRTPETRYIVANTYGIPAKIAALINWLLPDRLGDIVLANDASISGAASKTAKGTN